MIARAALLLAALFWAGNYAVGRVMADRIPPVTLSLLRWLVALCVLLPFVLSRLSALRRHVRDNLRWLLVMALTAIVLHPVLTYTALEYTTATNMSLIIAGTPGMALLLSTYMHGERHGLFPVGIVALNFAGIAVLVWQRVALPNGGDLLACVAMTLWAYYNVSLRDAPPGLDGIALTTVLTAIGVLCMLPLCAAELALGRSARPTWDVAAAVLYVGLFASGLAYLLWNRGVVALGAIHAAQFMNLVPLFGVLIGTELLDEPFTPRHGVAAALILVALLLSECGRGRRPAER
jgi:drug/metabolite transporter (DMT)-like permease